MNTPPDPSVHTRPEADRLRSSAFEDSSPHAPGQGSKERHAPCLSAAGNDRNPLALRAIVESRTCLRGALSAAIRQAGGSPEDTLIADYPNVASLVEHVLRRGASPLTVLLGQPEGTRSIDEDVVALRGELLGIRIAILVDEPDPDALALWRRLKPATLIPSSYTPAQVATCLDMVSAGISFLPSDWVDNLLAQSLEDHASDSKAPAFDQSQVCQIAANLTPRQREVMRHVAMGRSNKYIASELDVCESTIKVHVSELLRRLDATSRTHAAWLFSQLPSRT